MPLPNFHSCRLNNPISGADTATTSRTSENGKKYNIINQRQANGSMAEQAFRYPKDTWSTSEASAHCKRHDGILFEPASTTAMEYLKNEHTLKEGKKEYLIIPRGDFDHPTYGKLAFNDALMDEMVNNFKNNALRETKPFVDQDHDQRGAAGWIVGLRKAAEGIYSAIEWTTVGVELIKNKIYKYFSPTIAPYTDPESGEEFRNVLRGGALTNIPFLKMLPEITLEEPGLVEIRLSEITEYEKKDTKMNYLNDLKKKFGIEEKDDEKAFAAILVKIEEQAKLAEAGADTKELDELKKQVTDMKAELEKTKTELSEKNKTKPDLEIKLDEAVKSNKALSEKMTFMERDSCIKKALSEGRMLPDSRKKYEGLYMQNPALMEEAINSMPKVIELKVKSNPNEPDKKTELSEIEKQYHKALGNTEEDIKKYRDI